MERTPAQAHGLAVEFARQLDGLHQLLYTRGGIRPSNAAVEELTKLLLLRIAIHHHPRARVPGFGRLDEVTAERLAEEDGPALAKAAFTFANGLPSLCARTPTGEQQTVWPADEPLRISRSDVLAEAFSILAPLEFGSVEAFDPLGTAFDVFLRGRYEHGGGLGTYLTPQNVVEAMVRIGFGLLEARTPELVGMMGDPCCGSGRFLIGLLHEARRRGGTVRDLHPPDSVFGADQSASSIAMARVNLLAAGVAEPRAFVVEDSITDPSVSSGAGKFSLILTNPPFGDKKYDSVEGVALTGRWLPRLARAARIDPAYAFVARCIELLADGGIAGIILPDGVADSPAMRQLLLTSGMHVTLEGIVSLPSVTFAPAGTMAKTSVVFLRKAPRPVSSTAFLARVDHVGYVMSKGAAAVDPAGDDLPAIADHITAGLRGGALEGRGPATVVPVENLAALDASSFDPEADRARSQLVSSGGVRAGTLLIPMGRRRRPLDPTVPFISVLHVDEIGAIDWHLAARHQPTTSGQLARPGEVLVSLLNPRKFRAAVVPLTSGPVHCSAEFGVFQSVIDPYAALALLQHPQVRQQIAPLGRGTSSSRRRIEPADVCSLVLPPFDDGWADKAARVAQQAFDAISAGRLGLRELYEKT